MEINAFEYFQMLGIWSKTFYQGQYNNQKGNYLEFLSITEYSEWRWKEKYHELANQNPKQVMVSLDKPTENEINVWLNIYVYVRLTWILHTIE